LQIEWNPWVGGYRPQIPVLSALFPQLNLLNPPQTKFLGMPLSSATCLCLRLGLYSRHHFLFLKLKFHETKHWHHVCLFVWGNNSVCYIHHTFLLYRTVLSITSDLFCCLSLLYISKLILHLWPVHSLLLSPVKCGVRYKCTEISVNLHTKCVYWMFCVVPFVCVWDVYILDLYDADVFCM
jgi:hypothetical protein